jgi:biopolymer transport protein ExbD
MSWNIRHEGSPKSVGGLTLQQVAEGLHDGRWEPTDEVMGPQDKAWVVIENHPQLAEVAADLEQPAPAHHDDETHLDMNALIDVCLVLLIFFMLLLIYAVAMQKMFESPNLTSPEGVPKVTKQQVEDKMIEVKVTQGSKGPVILIQGREVDKDSVPGYLFRLNRSQGKYQLLLDYDRAVPHGTIVAIEDAAKAAGISQIFIAVPKEELSK